MLLPWATVWIRPFNAWQAYAIADVLLFLLAVGGLALAVMEHAGRTSEGLRLSVAAGACIGAVWIFAKVVSPAAQGFEEQYRVLVGSGLIVGLLCIAGLGLASCVLLYDGRSMPASVAKPWQRMDAKFQWALGLASSVLALGRLQVSRRAGPLTMPPISPQPTTLSFVWCETTGRVRADRI